MKGWMSTGEAARSLGVSPNRIRQLVSSGQLPASRIGRNWVIRRADVERYRSLPAGAKGRPRAVGKAGRRGVTRQ
jgi:excisionase family DNA binding protein